MLVKISQVFYALAKLVEFYLSSAAEDKGGTVFVYVHESVSKISHEP